MNEPAMPSGGEPQSTRDAAVADKPAGVPDSVPRTSRWAWLVLACGPLSLGAVELTHQGEFEDGAIVVGVFATIAPVVWALLWAFVGRLTSGRFRFLPHMVVGAIGLAAALLREAATPPAEAWTTQSSVRAYSVVVLGAIAVWIVQRTIVHLRRGRSGWVVWTISVLLGAVVGLGVLASMSPTLDVRADPGFFPGTALFWRKETLSDASFGRIFSDDSLLLGARTSTPTAAARALVDAVRVNASLMIDRTEVKVHAYRECMADGACWPAGTIDTCTFGQEKSDQLPVTCVRIADARAYCAWVRGRLPTEAEWALAASGAAKGARYPWGDARPTCARAVLDGCGDGPQPVGGRVLGKSPCGALDLIGNVAEWVDVSATRIAGVASFRGGSFHNKGHELNNDPIVSPWTVGDDVGFRCAYDR